MPLCVLSTHHEINFYHLVAFRSATSFPDGSVQVDRHEFSALVSGMQVPRSTARMRNDNEETENASIHIRCACYVDGWENPYGDGEDGYDTKSLSRTFSIYEILVA
jgi:hypothetical protein